jgi:hypothetical protein
VYDAEDRASSKPEPPSLAKIDVNAHIIVDRQEHVGPIPESWRESDEGMEADFEKLTLSLTGVCNAKILDSSF